MNRIGSDTRWTVAGVVVALVATVLLAGSIGIALTRPDESGAVTAIAPLGMTTPKKIVVVGDSYTEGTPQGGLGDKSWTELSWRQLRREGARITPEVSAKGGSGYAMRGPNDVTFADDLRAVLSPDDDVVVLFGGSNDVTEPPETLSAAVSSTLATVRTSAPNAKIIVVGPVSAGPDPPAEVLTVRDILRDQAASAGATFVDPIADRWFAANPELIGADGIHPTDQGHVYISERLLPFLRSALTPQPPAGG
jgi:lysophospholipase L1-like esterase